MNTPLSHELVMQEVASLLGDRGLEIGDFEIDRNGVLHAETLPRTVGGIRLTSGADWDKLTLDKFSNKILAPWMTRVARLKALYLDLKMLGVAHD